MSHWPRETVGGGGFLSPTMLGIPPHSRTPYFMKSGDLAIACSNSEKDSMLSLSRSDSFRTWTGVQKQRENQKGRWGCRCGGQSAHAECYREPSSRWVLSVPGVPWEAGALSLPQTRTRTCREMRSCAWLSGTLWAGLIMGRVLLVPPGQTWQ